MNQESTRDFDDRELLRRFVQQGSVEAFSQLVQRQVNAVFCAALRRVNGDHSLAEDVTQMVFADLARKAATIPETTPLGGWLHRHTGFVASHLLDREQRRRLREHRAATMNAQDPAAPDPEWSTAAPLLDAALDALPASDRDALVLRFMEQRDFRSVGAALGLSEDTAQKKVSRALDKLRQVLERRGVRTSAGALSSLMALFVTSPAPASLTQDLAGKSLAAALTTGRTLGGAITGLAAGARWKIAAAATTLLAAGFASHALLPNAKIPPAPLASSSASSPAAATVAQTPTPAAAVPTASPDTLGAAALVDAAAEAWSTGLERLGATSKAYGFLCRISPAEMEVALSHAGKQGDQHLRDALIKALLTLWTETNPQKALEWARSDAAGTRRADYVQGIYSAWGGRDPAALLGWGGKTSSHSSLPLNETVIATTFRTLAAQNAELAFSYLSVAPSALMRGQALRGMLETVRTAEDRENLLSLAAKVPDGEIRLQARRAIVEQWASQHPEEAAAYVEKAEPAWERTRLMDSLGFAWMQIHPGEAARWWTQHAPGPDTLVKIVNVWVQQDPNLAAAWLEEQPRGPASDTARMTFARQVADLDPESALRWAATVSDASQREDTINQVFSNWHSRDANAAAQFLQRSGWPQDRAARLKKFR